MAFEEGIGLVWYLVIGLAILAVVIGFYVLFQPSPEGGPITNLVDALTRLFGLR